MSSQAGSQNKPGKVTGTFTVNLTVGYHLPAVGGEEHNRTNKKERTDDSSSW
jgi:hypothetical protein